MAIYKEKQKQVNAVQVVFGQALPSNVQVNALSSTGYSYDDLSNVVEPDDPDATASRKGFEVSDRDFIVMEAGRVYRMSEIDFNNKYEVA